VHQNEKYILTHSQPRSHTHTHTHVLGALFSKSNARVDITGLLLFLPVKPFCWVRGVSVHMCVCVCACDRERNDRYLLNTHTRTHTHTHIHTHTYTHTLIPDTATRIATAFARLPVFTSMCEARCFWEKGSVCWVSGLGERERAMNVSECG
jgi:hypothetical protein